MLRRSICRPAGLRRQLLGVGTIRVGLTTGSMRFNSTTSIQSEIAPIDQVVDVISKVPVDQIGYFQSVGLAKSWWWPPDLFQHVFELVHHYTGLPWWATIAMVTVGMRTLMFPLYLKASDSSAKMQQLRPELNRLMMDYNTSDDPMDSQKILMQRKTLMTKHDIKTRQLMYPLLSMPFFVGTFSAINGMAAVPVYGFLDQGLLWFSNLAAPDPYLGLQLLTASLYAGTFKLGGETGSNTMSPMMQKIFTWVPFVAVPLMMGVPSGTCFYFLLNGMISILQTFAFKNAKFRSFFKMSELKPPPVDPNGANMSIMDSWRQLYEKTKARTEKTQREMAREQMLKDEKMKTEARKYIQRDPNVKKRVKK